MRKKLRHSRRQALSESNDRLFGEGTMERRLS
jgi:hypothetical protein